MRTFLLSRMVQLFSDRDDLETAAAFNEKPVALTEDTSQISRSIFYYRKFIDKYEELDSLEQMFIGGEDIGEVKMFIEKNEGEAGG